MTQTLAVLLSITALFVLLLTVKSIFKVKICPLCVGVSLTWIGLLIARSQGFVFDQTIIAVLIGESIVGLYHLIEKRTKENWGLFRLPFLLSLTVAAFLLLGVEARPLPALVFMLVLWLALLMINTWRNCPLSQNIIKKLIACCRDW